MNKDFVKDLIALLEKYNAYVYAGTCHQGYIESFGFLEEGTNKELFVINPDSKDSYIDIPNIKHIIDLNSWILELIKKISLLNVKY